MKNYIAIVGSRNEQEKVRYYGEKLVLKCQELGHTDRETDWFVAGILGWNLWAPVILEKTKSSMI